MYDKEQAQSNASTIGSEIEHLKTGHYEIGAFGVIQNYRYRDFWVHAKEIVGMFKTLKPLSREDRERLWQTYQEACQNMKGIQNEGREQSRIDRGNIESRIKDAYSTAGGSTSISGVDADKEMLDRARAMQTETMNIMKEGKLVKEDREACWQYWREVNQGIVSKREQTQEGNYINIRKGYHVQEALQKAAYGDPYEAMEHVKAAQASMKGAYISREQRQELHDLLQDAWQSATSKIGEIKEEKRRKYQDWRERIEGNIGRWEGRIEGAEAFISRLESQIEDLEEKVRDAWSDKYVLRAGGWIVEKYSKIAEVQGQIRDLEVKIEDVKAKLDG